MERGGGSGRHMSLVPSSGRDLVPPQCCCYLHVFDYDQNHRLARGTVRIEIALEIDIAEREPAPEPALLDKRENWT